MPELPDDRRYTREHEWAREEGGKVTIGITDYAQDQLGDVVFVDLPDPGADVSAGRPLGEVESTKSVSDVYSPISGAVVTKNSKVEKNPELLNSDPYGEAWLVVVEPSDGGSLDSLMSADDYRSYIEGL
ncbi:MAG: glycine cleavage system protein GcvH [Actinobacteria bacterium]|nr:glycine cleavage system protein GcvH [Actinomycetota bacterium]